MLKDFSLYLILDAEVCSYIDLLNIAKQAAEGGVDIIQLRDKKGLAKDIVSFLKELQKALRGRIPFIVNDRVDLVLAGRASGVHLGQEDLPAQVARKLLGPRAIIGVSCQTFEQAKKAQREGADYIGFGSVFKTQTKPDRRPMDLALLEKVCKTIEIPVFAIGGVTTENILTLRHRGVKRVAVCRQICCANNVKLTTHLLKRFLRE